MVLVKSGGYIQSWFLILLIKLFRGSFSALQPVAENFIRYWWTLHIYLFIYATTFPGPSSSLGCFCRFFSHCWLPILFTTLPLITAFPQCQFKDYT